MRRPRAGDERSSRSRAAPGLRPGALRPPARSSLTAGPLRPARGWKARLPKRGRAGSAEGGAKRSPEARPGAVTTPRWRAERRHTFARRCDLQCNDAPIGAPSPRFFRGARKWTTAYPAPQRIRAAERWLVGCRPREGGDPYSAAYREGTAYGSRASLANRSLARDDNRVLLMQPKLAVDRFQLGRLDQLAMRDLHRMQRAFQLLLPELQETSAAREIPGTGRRPARHRTAAANDDRDADTGCARSSGRSRRPVCGSLQTQAFETIASSVSSRTQVSISGTRHCKLKR